MNVETEVNGDSKSTNERGSSLVVFWAEIFGYLPLAAPVGSVQNIFFLAIHNFNSFVPIAQQAGQAAVPSRLSLSLCLFLSCIDTHFVPRGRKV